MYKEIPRNVVAIKASVHGKKMLYFAVVQHRQKVECEFCMNDKKCLMLKIIVELNKMLKYDVIGKNRSRSEERK